jgi:Cu+-exporting ATPase
MAIFDQRFHYFCNRTTCRAAFLGEPPELTPETKRAAEAAIREENALRRATLDAPIIDAFPPVTALDDLPDVPATDDDRSLVEPFSQTILSEGPSRFDAPDPRDIGALLLVIAVIAGALAVALSLAGDAVLVIGARIVLAGVGASMLIGRAATTPREETDPHPIAVLTPSVTSLGIAVWAALGPDRALGAEVASLAGIIVTSTAVSAWLVETARHGVFAERAWIGAALAIPGRRMPKAPVSRAGDERERERDRGAPAEGGKNKVFDIRPGEEVLVEPGEIVPVDLTVTGGDVEVLPWVSATTQARRRNGDAVVAGARVVRGKLRGICTFAGNDRAFARVLLDPRRRADALAPVAHAARSLAERWAIAAAIVGGIISLVARRSPIEVVMTAVAVHAALATALIAAVPSVHVLRGILLGLRRGIVYKSADAWDRAGRVVMAMFCARGTLLLGEPEVAELEAIGPKIEPNDVLSLAAGAERAQEHPIATAILRAARTRGVHPDGVRNATMVPGLGVTAITSGGEELCVGNRSLILEKRISIAASEARIAELESLGRTVILVAAGSRLAGLLALQDGLRPGARASVQHLIDAQIEPVLMSGDARETCEAIGRSLDIDHIRPEILPADRSAEVRRLIDAGASVAVLGHAGIDDGALGAADVSVALGAAGSAPGDFAIALASEDVRDAALSLALAHRTRLEARVGLALAVVPGLVGMATISFGLMPQAFAPIAALLGGVMAIVHARSLR